MGTNVLAGSLDRDSVAALTDPGSFERGLDYAEEGRVGPITETDGAIEATVSGTYPYDVRVVASAGEIIGFCSCPMGEQGVFCKHCVALAAAWVVGPGELVPTNDEPAVDPPTTAPLDMADGESPADLKRELTRATRVRGFVDYSRVPAFAYRIGMVADEIEELIGRGGAEDAIALSEYGLRRVESAIMNSDDSDGLLGDLLRRFERIHLIACRVAHPDQRDLARTLFDIQMDSEFGSFHNAPERYQDVLGGEGLAEYRRLAEERWADVPERREWRLDHPHDEFTVTSMMDSLARAAGDIDELVAVMSRDLSSGYQYLQIAQVCLDDGRHDAALDWAERGVRAWPEHTDVRLREFLAERYLELGRTDRAMAFIWAEFDERRDVEAYRRLRRFAGRTEAGDEWRTRALDLVRQSAEASPGARDASELVAMLTWDGDLDGAWAEAHRTGCASWALMPLARRSEASHPTEVVAVYQDEVADTLRTADRRAYAEAIVLLRRIKRLMDQLGRAEEFGIYATEVRAANARRPVFCKMFDAAGLAQAAAGISTATTVDVDAELAEVRRARRRGGRGSRSCVRGHSLGPICCEIRLRT